MYIKQAIHLFFAFMTACLSFSAYGFQQKDSGLYVSQFSQLTADSYSAVDDLSKAPGELRNACRNMGQQTSTGTVVVTEAEPTVLGAGAVQQRCGETNECVIGNNVTVDIDESLKLHSLVVSNGGTVRWNGQTQTDPDTWLCTGYAVVEGGGTWDMDLQSASKRAWIYIMNNGATHSGLRTRAFGSYMPMDHDDDGHGMSHPTPHLSVIGRELDRTWSLLAEPLTPDSMSIKVMHDPNEMGWQPGDRIAIAPTEGGSGDDAQDFSITAMASDGTITLDTSSNGSSTHKADPSWAGVAEASLRSAEVINLSRNIIVTGDDFEEVACDDSLESIPGFGTSTEGCSCDNNYDRDSCTMGLHTASAHGGFSEIANVRVEKCGQRGVEGKYCLHFHHMGDSSADGTTSISRNNAVEFSQQRGLIVHSTHNAQVESNVFYDVRGANLYIEDGNEMLNTIAYNVAICPYADNGCSLPGTSNGQGDTSLNQSGLYMESPNNLLIGNRMANHFNGMFNNAGNGRGPVDGQVCGDNAPFGLWEGNTFHSSGRFGTYLLNGNFPRQNTAQSVANNGTTNFDDDCAAYDGMGEDMGLSSVILSHFDYGNTFVGQYGAGDIQYKNHVNIDNLNAVYWKETKTMQDGWSAHISESYFEDGSADLPDAMGAFIIENTTFKNYGLRANHHCDVGGTGYLCMPQYVLHNVTWLEAGDKWTDFDINNGETNYGGIFTLSPENIADKANGETYDFFPAAYNSVVGQNFDYLLDLPDENCVRSGNVDLNGQNLGDRYGNGILCGASLTALKIFTRNHSGGDLLVTVFDNQTDAQLAQQRVPYLRVSDRKQGYALPVISGDKYRYDVALASGGDIGSDWVIDFGDLAVSNRWGEELLYLDVQGRICDSPISSYHDRRFYAAGEFTDAMWGRGACASRPLMAAASYGSTPDLTLNQDPVYAEWHARLDAAGGALECGPNGAISARYLGSDVPVLPDYQCVCKEGWSGNNCSVEGEAEMPTDPDPTDDIITIAESGGTETGTGGSETGGDTGMGETEGSDGSDGTGTDPEPVMDLNIDITIDERSLVVNGSRYEMKGVAWNPVPAGGTHPNDLDFSGYADIDIPLMQYMGINTVRTYEPILDTVVLDKLYAAGIKVINSAYNWGGANVNSVDAVVNAVKGHPAILMWSVGNEWNYNGLYVDLDDATSAARVNAVSERIKQLDPDTPVATIYGELPSTELVNQLNHVDVWAINVYRGISFGNLFDQWHTISDKPMFIGEYGADAYNANDTGSGAFGYDPQSQSDAVVALTREIFDNIVTEDASGNQRGVLGGTFFEWADEWWKAGNPNQQDNGGVAPGGGPYPDSTFNEEYWGIVDIDRNQRCGFFNLKALYSSIASDTPFNEAACNDEIVQVTQEELDALEPINTGTGNTGSGGTGNEKGTGGTDDETDTGGTGNDTVSAANTETQSGSSFGSGGSLSWVELIITLFIAGQLILLRVRGSGLVVDQGSLNRQS